MTYDLSSKLRGAGEYDHRILFLRSVAFQQLPYQFEFSYYHLSRQAILFSYLDDNHFIKKEFREKTGLEIQEYLDLSLATLIRFIDGNETFLPVSWLDNLSSNYSNGKVLKFLGLISKDINEIRQNLINGDSRKRRAIEHFELTPFIDYPLIKTSENYLLTNKNILFSHCEYYIYDLLKEINTQKFMSRFGRIFEQYIEKVLKRSKVNYLAERGIKTKLGREGNQIDFLIQEEGANIFVDAKAVEMNIQAKTTHLAKILRDKTKESILKAIRQAHDVIRKITDNHKCVIPKCRDNYLLVITYKNLYLGNGALYYESIAKSKMDEIYKKYKGYDCIPPENIYFMTIDEFDILFDALVDDKLTLAKVIEKAKFDTQKLESRKFDLFQHLQSMGVDNRVPSYLAQETDNMLSRIRTAIK